MDIVIQVISLNFAAQIQSMAKNGFAQKVVVLVISQCLEFKEVICLDQQLQQQLCLVIKCLWSNPTILSLITPIYRGISAKESLSASQANPAQLIIQQPHHNLKMQGSRPQDPSPSTLYRYHRSQKTAQLPLFLHFKHQYQAIIPQPKIQAIKAVYQHGVCGRNKAGQTVVVDRIGNIRIQGLHKVLQEEELVAYMNQRMLELSEKILREQEQVVWVIDLSGKIMQLASKKILEAIEKVIFNANKFFPNMLYKLIFVNTPMLFDTIWSKIAPSIHKETQQKIVMIADEIENLYEFAQQQVLPDFLGGQLDEQAFLYGRREQPEKEQQSEEEQEVDFSSLKQALGGLKIGGGTSTKSVLQTPLNTEADDK